MDDVAYMVWLLGVNLEQVWREAGERVGLGLQSGLSKKKLRIENGWLLVDGQPIEPIEEFVPWTT